MPAESVERRAPAKSTAGMPPPPPEQEHLPCPRCDSTNTKFCYYNNYNLSQPRHFCKSCRRYWTQGGTLRDIPVGGGTRKNAKRSRTLPPTTSSTTDTVHVSSASGAAPFLGHSGALGLVPSVGGSFTSLLNASGSGSGGSGGFLGLGGLGLGIDDSGLGPLSRAMWAFPEVAYIGGAGNGNGVGGTWQMESGGEQGIGSFVGGDCFSCWPELAISTPGNALK